VGRAAEGDVQAHRRPADAPDKPRVVTIGFEQGVPVRLDGERSGRSRSSRSSTDRGRPRRRPRSTSSRTAWSGIKSRGVYETPAGTVLYIAHREIERLVLDRDTLHFKQSVSVRYAQLIYDGLWFSTLREALAGFVDDTEQEVTGEVQVRSTRARGGRRPPLAAQPLPPGPRDVRRGHGLRPQATPRASSSCSACPSACAR
jgi:argininosuccinate synthase